MDRIYRKARQKAAELTAVKQRRDKQQWDAQQKHKDVIDSAISEDLEYEYSHPESIRSTGDSPTLQSQSQIASPIAPLTSEIKNSKTGGQYFSSPVSGQSNGTLGQALSLRRRYLDLSNDADNAAFSKEVPHKSNPEHLGVSETVIPGRSNAPAISYHARSTTDTTHSSHVDEDDSDTASVNSYGVDPRLIIRGEVPRGGKSDHSVDSHVKTTHSFIDTEAPRLARKKLEQSPTQLTNEHGSASENIADAASAQQSGSPDPSQTLIHRSQSTHGVSPIIPPTSQPEISTDQPTAIPISFEESKNNVSHSEEIRKLCEERDAERTNLLAKIQIASDEAEISKKALMSNEAENLQLRANLDSSVTQLKEVESSLTHHKTTLNEVCARLDEYQTRISNLEGEVETATDEVGTLRLKQAEHIKLINQYSDGVQRLQQDRVHLQSDIAHYKKEVEDAKKRHTRAIRHLEKAYEQERIELTKKDAAEIDRVQQLLNNTQSQHLQYIERLERFKVEEMQQLTRDHEKEVAKLQESLTVLREGYKDQLTQFRLTQEESISQLKLKHKVETSSLHQKQKDVEQEHIHKLEQVNKANQSEMSSLNQKYGEHLGRAHQAKLSEISDLNQKHKNAIDRLLLLQQIRERGHKDALDRTDREILALKRDHWAELELLRSQLAISTKKANQSRQTLIQAHNEAISRLKNTHTGEMSRKANELQDAKRDAESRLASQSAVHRERLEKTEASLALQLRKYREELDKVTTEAKETLALQDTTHAAELDDMNTQHETNMRNLRNEVKHYQEALLKNDNEMYKGLLFATSSLPAKSDDKIYNQWYGVEQIVDSIGRLHWKAKPAVWTNKNLQEVRSEHMDRAIKKAIVQDVTWCLLHHYVLASPFRVFHVEGKELESQWSAACDTGMYTPIILSYRMSLTESRMCTEGRFEPEQAHL